MQEDVKIFSNFINPVPWLSLKKRLSSKQEIASLNLAGALDLPVFVNRFSEYNFLQMSRSVFSIIIIIINNQPTDKVQRPVGWNTMKIGLSSSTYPGLYGSSTWLFYVKKYKL